MVAKWLHRSRDSLPRNTTAAAVCEQPPWLPGAAVPAVLCWGFVRRKCSIAPLELALPERGSVAAMDSAGDSAGQPPSRAKVTVTVYKDLVLQHYGFEICPGLPLTIASITAGSTADGKLQPGDQLIMINSSTVEGLSVERAASLIRDAGDELLLTVLRCTAGGPKSSFLTEEKRARLKTNPVKVRFAEEVLLNGHSQVSAARGSARAGGSGSLCPLPCPGPHSRSLLRPGLIGARRKHWHLRGFGLDVLTRVNGVINYQIGAAAALALQGSCLLFMPNVLKVYLENGQTKAFRFESSTTVKDIVLTLQEKLSIRSIAHFALVLEEQYNLAKIHLLHEEELIAQVVQKRDSHDYRCLFRVCFVPRDPLDLMQEDPVAFEYLYLQSCSDVLQERFAVEMKCSVALRLAALHIQERISACAQPQKVSLKYIERDWGIENFISPTLLRNMRGKDIKKAISYHLKRNQVLLDPRQKHTLSAAQVRLSYLQILGELKMYSGMIFNATMMLQDRESYVALLVGARHGVSQIVNSKLNIASSLAEFPSISRVELSEDSERVSTVKIYLQDLKVLTLLLESNSAKDLVCLIAGYYRLLVDANASIFTWGEKQQQLHRVSAEEGYESRACSDSEDSCEPGSGSERRPGSPAASGGAAPGAAEPRGPAASGDTGSDSASEASDSANAESRGLRTSGSSDSVDALEEDEADARPSSGPGPLRFCTPGVWDTSGSESGFVPGCAAGSPAGSGGGTGDGFCSPQARPGGGPAGQGEAPAPLPEGSAEGGRSPGSGASPAPAPPGTAGHGEPVLRPPPGFADSSSEEEFYDAADRLSPPAGYDAASWEGTGSSSCIPKRLRCYSLGENPSTREKQGQERELICSKSLRKRRSFLKTDYTSQVSFPAAAPGSAQRCCSWPPTQPSAEDTGKDVERGIPAAPQAQRDTAGTEPCSAPRDTQPGATGAKSVMEWLVSSLLDIRPHGGQGGEEESSLQPQQPPLLSLEPLPHSARGAAQWSCPGEAGPGCVSHESPVPAAGWQSPGPQEERGEVVPARHKASVVPSAVVCPSDELLLLPPAPVPSTAPPRELAQGQGLLPARVEPSLAPCGESKAHGQSCATDSGGADGQCRADAQGSADSQGGADGQCHASGRCCTDGEIHADIQGSASSSCEGAVSRAGGWQGASRQTLLRVHEGHTGLPDTAQLLAGCSSAPGALTRLSWLALGVRAAPVSHSPGAHSPVSRSLQDRANVPLEPLGCVMPSGCSGAGAGGRKVPTSPASGAGCARELVGSSGPGAGQPGDAGQPGGAGIVAQQQPQRAQAPLPRGQAAGLGPGSCLPPAAGLSISSVPAAPGKGAGDHGAVTHSFLCFNPEEGEQTPLSPVPHGLESCGCRLPYISCFPQPHSQREGESSPPQLPGPLTCPPSSGCSLARTPGGGLCIAGDRAGQEPHLRALGQLKQQAWASPADLSRFLAYTVELQQVVGQLCGNQATHLHRQCAEQGAESRGALGWASQDLLSSCQALLSAEQPLPEVQCALRATFDRLVQLAVTCFQVARCQHCGQRQQELGAALGRVVGTYQQLVQALQQQLHGQVCPELGAKLLARQHMALAAAILCLLQQFRASPRL
ncbi:FERM and PDZ domain-containing protein 1 [Ammospiza nelsoni]|uniref:FERM and PDZ domain-containing protein 1 n=1 Tax=Ammospiza nelsoni TaxID=2857394 RepID=UPI00286A8564|nr:FERM and PDZ domain-containing protein 1 [Ammospiza nelsoni]